MSSSLEATGALNACKDANTEVWLGFTLQGIRKNTLPSGESVSDALTAVEKYDIDAYLINCSSANITTEAIKLLSQEIKKPYGGYANSVNVGHIEEGNKALDNAENMQEEYRQLIDANEYSKTVEKWISDGATIVGGCCGTSPEHIKKIHDLINQG